MDSANWIPKDASPVVESLATRYKETKRVTMAYFHSHWNMLEWIFTVRLFVAALVILINRGNPFGFILLGLGTFGFCVSGQWVRNFWLNIMFAISVFLLSVGLAILHASKGNFLFYVHVLDMALSVWLCKRITEERFYYNACPDRF